MKKLLVVFFALFIVVFIFSSLMWGSETTPRETELYIKFSFPYAIVANDMGAVTVSPLGDMVAMSSMTPGTPSLVYGLSSGEEVAELSSPTMISLLSFSPDNRMVAGYTYLYRSHIIYIWDVASSKVIQTITNEETFIPRDHYPRPPVGVIANLWGDDGQYLIDKVLFMDFVDENTLVTASYYGTVRVFDAPTGTLLKQFQTLDDQSRSRIFCLSPDKTCLVETSKAGNNTRNQPYVGWWSVWTGGDMVKNFYYTNQAAPVSSISFSPNGEKMAVSTGGGYNEIVVWDVETTQQVSYQKYSSLSTAASITPQSYEWINSIQFAADKLLLLSVSNNNKNFLKIFDTEKWNLKKELPYQFGYPRVSKKNIVSIGSNEIYVWEDIEVITPIKDWLMY